MFDVSLKSLKLMRLNALMHLKVLKLEEATNEQKNDMIKDVKDLLQSLEKKINDIEGKYDFTNIETATKPFDNPEIR